jgi:Secretion system C-terminal sorting domain
MKNVTLLIACILLFALNGFSQEELSENITKYDVKTQNLTLISLANGIEVTVNSDEEGSITFTPTDKYWDITQWVFLSLEINNLCNEEVRFDPVLQYDNPRRGTNVDNVYNTHIGFLHPNENLIYNCVMIRDNINALDYPQFDDFPGMKGLPDGVIMNFAGIDAKHIKEFKIVFPAQNFERKVVIKRIFKKRPALPELYMINKESFFPFINEYGQYKHDNWEEKITDDSQFAEAIKREADDLEKHPGSDEWNRFGGFAVGPKYDATGNFRTQKIDGKWWIIDPDGCLFWSAGVNSAGSLTVSTPYWGREHFFEDLPKNTSEKEGFFDGTSYKFGLANLYRKYGENCEEEYVATSLKRMKSWGLNTLGGWSVETVGQYSENIKLPYTVYINATNPGINDKFPDVFDPEWKTDVEAKIIEKAEVVKDDPYFFGFFINNEIHWGNPLSFAKNLLEKEGDCIGKQVYIDLLKQRLVSITEFNELTGATNGSWEDLLTNEINTNGLDIYALKEVNIEHYTNMCEMYFKITKELIDKYAPGKMYIGCRWNGNHKNQYNMSAAEKYLDIFTFNEYINEVELYPYPPQNIDKPFIISEFNFGALDRGKFFTGLGYASNQRNRGEKYENFIKGALRNPKCVGAHWFMWANTTTAGRGNGENANCGLVSATDQIYYELISFIRETTYQMYSFRTDYNTTGIFKDSMYSDKYKDIFVSPNPVDSMLDIHTEILDLQGKIFDLKGELIWEGLITDGKIDMNTVERGIYILNLTTGEGSQSIRIIKN